MAPVPIETQPAEAGELDRRLAQIEAGDEPEEIELDALDPADFDAGRPHRLASTPVPLSVQPR